MALEGAGSPGGEAYRSLRTAVRFIDVGRPVRTLLVSSPSTGEGKTTTASNLAVAFAQSGERVLVVDADLRHHELSNLRIVGGSAFPTYSAHHPTLTICALAIRLGRALGAGA